MRLLSAAPPYNDSSPSRHSLVELRSTENIGPVLTNSYVLNQLGKIGRQD